MSDLISVIVPIYNVEKYLNRCIDSIVQQTYRCLEIILVEDGSPDACPEICDEWKKKDKRIKVIHKLNGGLSDARNAGLEIATGEYIVFIDSDDWVDEKYIEYLYINSKKNDADIVACDLQWTDDSTAFCDSTEEFSVTVYNLEEALRSLIDGEDFRAVVWNKLYKRNLLVGETFEIGRYHEDEFFSYRILGKANKLVYINAKLYFYFQREGSIMNTLSYRHLDSLDAYLCRISYLEKKFPELYKIDKMRFCISCINFYQEAFQLNEIERKKCTSRIKLCRRKVSFNVSELKQYKLKEIIYVIGSKVCPDLLSRILLIRKKNIR